MRCSPSVRNALQPKHDAATASTTASFTTPFIGSIRYLCEERADAGAGDRPVQTEIRSLQRWCKSRTASDAIRTTGRAAASLHAGFRPCKDSIFCLHLHGHCLLTAHASQTAEIHPLADARPHLGDEGPVGRLPHLRRRPHARHHRMDSLDAGQVRCQGDLLRAGQERGDVSRSLPPHRRGRPPHRQPHLLPPEGMGHEPRTLYRRRRLRQRPAPHRTVPPTLRPHHAGAGASAGQTLQAGDVGRPLARLQPCAVAPHLPAQRHALPRRRVDRRLPRFRKVVPQHELRPCRARFKPSATWDSNARRSTCKLHAPSGCGRTPGSARAEVPALRKFSPDPEDYGGVLAKRERPPYGLSPQRVIRPNSRSVCPCRSPSRCAPHRL